MVCTVRQQVLGLENVRFALGQADRLRRSCQLETRFRELFGMLPLRRRPSGAYEIVAVGFCAKRSLRGAVSRRFHDNRKGPKPDEERQCVRTVDWRGRLQSGFLLLYFSKHASKSASGLCDGASTGPKIRRADIHSMRLVLSPASIRPDRF